MQKAYRAFDLRGGRRRQSFELYVVFIVVALHLRLGVSGEVHSVIVERSEIRRIDASRV